ncbi:MAG: RICIN domain-containing protein [Leifsonia sp.]
MHQQWLVRPVGNGTYAIESRLDGEVLNVNGNSTSDGGAIVQWPSTTAGNQQWSLTPVN